MADIYEGEYVHSASGVAYRLEIYAPSATALPGTPTRAKFAATAMMSFEVSGGYDTIPLGLPSMQTVKIKFDTGQLPTELLEWFTDALAQIDCSVTNGTGDPDTVTITAGPILEIYISSRREFLGIIGPEEPVDLKVIDGTIELSWTCAFATITRQIKPAQLARHSYLRTLAAGSSEMRTNHTYIEFAWYRDSEWWGVFGVGPSGRSFREIWADPTPGSVFWSITVNRFAATTAHFVEQVMNKVIRKTVGACNVETFIRDAFYFPRKQVFPIVTTPDDDDSYPNVDIAVPTAERRIIGWIGDRTTGYPADATIVHTYWDEMGESHETLWDYLSGLVKEHFRVGAVRYSSGDVSLWNAKAKATVSSAAAIPTVSLKISEYVRRGRSAILRATGSTQHRDGDDISAASSGVAGQNNQPFEIACSTWSNASAGDHELKYSGGLPTGFNLESMERAGRLDQHRSPRLGGLFYYDEVTNFDVPAERKPLPGGPYLIRCHAWRMIEAEGEAPPLPTRWGVRLWNTEPRRINGRGLAIEDQAQGTMMQQVADAVIRNFGHKEATTMKVRIGLYEGSFDGVVPLCFDPGRRKLTIDTSAIAPWLGDAITTWNIIDWKADMINGVCDYTLWGHP